MYSRKITQEELLEIYEKALKKYADVNNWNCILFLPKEDMNRDHCSGLYTKSGEIARQALNMKGATICQRTPNE